MGSRGPERAEHRITDEHLVILEHIAQGRTNPEIAERMGCSEYRINDQMKIIFRLLGVRTRAHAVAWALKHRFIPGGPAQNTP